MGYIDHHLLPHERIVYRAHLHWVTFAAPIALAVLAAAIGLLGAGLMPDPVVAGWTAAVVFAVALVLFVQRWIDWRTSEFGVTDKRVLVKVGLVRRRSLELLLRQVEMIGVEQGIVGRLLGFGAIVVGGTGGTKEHFDFIARPLEFRRQVQAQSADGPSVDRAAQTARATTPAADEKTCPQCAEQVKAAAKICRYCRYEFT